MITGNITLVSQSQFAVLRFREIDWLIGITECSRVSPSNSPKDDAFEQRISSDAIFAVHTTGDLASCKEAFEGRIGELVEDARLK
jgi:hypothetical protein